MAATAQEVKKVSSKKIEKPEREMRPGKERFVEKAQRLHVILATLPSRCRKIRTKGYVPSDKQMEMIIRDFETNVNEARQYLESLARTEEAKPRSVPPLDL